MAAVTRITAGVFRVDDDEGRQTLVYVAGTAGDLWAFCEGEIYREHGRKDAGTQSGPPKGGHDLLTAPMPATVVKILVDTGQSVKQGDTLVVLEAMKMELPIRAPADAVVQSVNCREGELVQPERTLVELA